MKERPIIFSGPMVRAILEGRKTQTRRIIKGSKFWGDHIVTVRHLDDAEWRLEGNIKINEILHGNPVTFVDVKCPYGEPGDRLWVRETFFESEGLLIYRESTPDSGPWKSPIYMPRWASRINLIVKSVRVERLQEITEEDAIAEGFVSTSILTQAGDDYTGMYAVEHFQDAWDTINKKRAPWESNPWVFVITFEKIDNK
jgi:hypothetical protein